MKLEDIPKEEVLLEQLKWQEDNSRPFTYEVLGKKYGSEKLVYKKMEKLADQDYLEYGVSLRTAWLTDKAKEHLKSLNT